MSLIGGVSGVVAQSETHPPVDTGTLAAGESTDTRSTATHHLGADAVSDGELMESVREGSMAAYGALYQRHVAAAQRCARQVCRSTVSAEDAVSEASVQVLAAMLAGGGPRSHFRAYLLTTVRHVVCSAARRARPLIVVDDLDVADQLRCGLVSAATDSVVMSRLDQVMAVDAFSRLPQRWQWVLRRATVGDDSLADLACESGLNRNGVSALAHRARRGLRTGFLQAHIDDSTVDPECRSAAPHLGAWTRGRLRARLSARVEAHLAKCSRCRARLRELVDINSQLPA